MLTDSRPNPQKPKNRAKNDMLGSVEARGGSNEFIQRVIWVVAPSIARVEDSSWFILDKRASIDGRDQH